jgi:predicted nucleic acid-binding protein
VTFVVDASVAVMGFVQEPGTDRALALLDHEPDLIAPDLLVLEVAHALWRKRRRGEIDPIDVTDALAWLRRGIPELVPTGGLLDEALVLMVALDHAVHGCCYVAVAEIAEARLVTDDMRLWQSLAGTRLASRVLPLAELGGR